MIALSGRSTCSLSVPGARGPQVPLGVLGVEMPLAKSLGVPSTPCSPSGSSCPVSRARTGLWRASRGQGSLLFLVKGRMSLSFKLSYSFIFLAY